MTLVDRALPTAQYLAGPDAADIVRVPVEAAGGELLSLRAVQVQYRPGSDVVVRYSASVSWGGGAPTRETLAAGSTVHGSYPGAIEVTAETSDGRMEVAVWRWPFDPVLSGLGEAVTPSAVARHLTHHDGLGIGAVDPRDLVLQVIAYRPTVRAVVRVSAASDGSPLTYLKVVDPGTARPIARRHDALTAAGVPVPDAHLIDETGIVALSPLVGSTMRELIKAGSVGLPDVAEFDRLAAGFSGAELSEAAPASRLRDGVLHARMLAVVHPREAERLDRLAELFRTTPQPATDGAIHGDLHEAQLVVVDGRIVGVFDIDDAGIGAAIDDRANLVARLLYRVVVDAPGSGLATYVERLRRGSAPRFDPTNLDTHIAAALVGLATGPFRIQSENWRDTVSVVLDTAEKLCMRELSE